MGFRPVLSVLACLIASLSAAPMAAAPARFDWFSYQGSDPVDAKAKPGPDSFRNPVLAGFYPDPSVVRVGEDYYLVNSTFSWYPGLPVWHSRDLVNWRQIGNAIDRPGMVSFEGKELSQGLFAATISWHDGLFYIANTCFACGGNFIITASNPAGPWSEPVWFKELGWGIDPSLFFDTDGSAWLLNNDVPTGGESWPGHRAVFLQRLDLKTMTLVGERHMILSGGVRPQDKPEYAEGPHIFRRGDYYYLTVAEGGTGTMHAQTVLRARTVTGPYAPFAGNPILTQRDLPPDRRFPITSTGHADLVDTPNGDWWAVFLATRPYRDDMYNTGRETFLLPVTWTRDGWPVILPSGQAVPNVAPRPRLPASQPSPTPTSGPFSTLEEFTGTALGQDWMSMRGPADRWARLRDGALELVPQPVGLGDLATPAFVARRQQHMRIEAATQVDFRPGPGEAAGLAILQRDEYWYAFVLADAERGKRSLQLLVRDGAESPRAGRLIAQAAAPDGPVKLRILVDADRVHFDWARPGQPWQRIVSDADATILSTFRARGFVGAMVGPYAVQSPVP